MTTDLIPRQTITTVCENVTQAKEDIVRAFTLLQSAKERLTAALGTQLPYGGYAHLWERDISDYDLLKEQECSVQYVARNAWRYVIDLCGLRSYMTEVRQKELQEQLANGQFPTLTPKNVLSTLQGFASRVDTLLTESAKEVFDWLRPHNPSSRAAQLKTNRRWQLGYKAIAVSGVETNFMQGYRLNYYREANFRALGNTLALLDGQGAQKSPHDLCTQLRTGLNNVCAGAIITTPYLTFKPYRNGNAHLVFLRHDLIDKLNAMCGDGTLPGEQ